MNVSDLCLSIIPNLSTRFDCRVHECGARCAGTGSSGATIRMYVEKYVAPEAGEAALIQDTAEAVGPLVKAALAMSDLAHLTGRKEPTVPQLPPPPPLHARTHARGVARAM